MINAVIFDFDGLILDTETAWFESYREALQTFYQFDLSLDAFVECVGSDDSVLFRYLQQELGSKVDAKRLREHASRLHTEKMKHAEAREGVAQMLAEAQAAGLSIVLASSSTQAWVTKHLTNLQLLSYFDHLVTQEQVEQIKPAPDLFLKALEVIGVQPNEAVVFEDSLNGLKAAQQAKIPTVIIPNPVTEALPFENVHLRLRSMAERSLQDIISTLQ